MTVYVNVKGTQAEMESLFNGNSAIRYYEPKGDKWHVVIRCNEDIFNRVRTIKGLNKKFGSIK